MTEEEYIALSEITIAFSSAEPSDSRVLRVSVSQSTPEREETTASKDVEIEAPEGA